MSWEGIQDWRIQETILRFQMIAPLLEEGIDKAKRNQLYRDIAEQNGLSPRTIRRYEEEYLKGGTEGLIPKEHSSKGPRPLPDNFGENVRSSIELRSELTSRSVAAIIKILELEGKAAPGEIKRSTLQRHLQDAGYGRHQLQKQQKAKCSSAKRFCMPHRMMLLQADIKVIMGIQYVEPEENTAGIAGIMPAGQDKTKKQHNRNKIYLTSILDDHSKIALVSNWYHTASAYIVEDTFREAFLLAGLPMKTYVDNGKQYVSKELEAASALLGVKNRHAPVHRGQAKGKIERFHQTVDDFIAELRLKEVHSLDEINQLWHLYLEEMYHNKPHEGIAEYYRQNFGAKIPPEGITPRQEWDRDSRKLNFCSQEKITEAFLHHGTRSVEDGYVVAFEGLKFPARKVAVGTRIAIAYDPRNTKMLKITCPGMDPYWTEPMYLGTYCAKSPITPEYLTPEKPKTSRCLDALIAKDRENPILPQDMALNFADYETGRMNRNSSEEGGNGDHV